MCRISKHKHAAGRLATALLGALCICDGIAQEDLTAPPRITETEPAAAPQPSTDTPELEEIVVISDQNPWRLPDLGSEWRRQQDEQIETGRISAELLPIWDPEAEEIPTRNPFAVTDSFRRVGFIEVFRVRFGRR